MPLGFRGFWGFGPGLSFRRVRTRVPGFVVWRQVRRCFPSCSLSVREQGGAGTRNVQLRSLVERRTAVRRNACRDLKADAGNVTKARC